jgi:D-alanyl-D-alanine carboxypeptidase
METVLTEIYRGLGITDQLVKSTKLSRHSQPSLENLKVVDIDFEGKPFILTSSAAQAWLQLKKGAEKHEVYLKPFSGFRSYLHQHTLIERHLKNGRALEDILTHIAIPGFSEHHTGKAIDIHANGHPVLEETFEKTEEFIWLSKNAASFGFRLSYPRVNTLGIIYEPWHWFYTGN